MTEPAKKKAVIVATIFEEFDIGESLKEALKVAKISAIHHSATETWDFFFEEDDFLDLIKKAPLVKVVVLMDCPEKIQKALQEKFQKAGMDTAVIAMTVEEGIQTIVAVVESYLKN